MEKYEEVKDIGDGNYSVVKLIRHKETRDLFAVKYISRGHKVCSYLLLVKYWFDFCLSQTSVSDFIFGFVSKL